MTNQQFLEKYVNAFNEGFQSPLLAEEFKKDFASTSTNIFSMRITQEQGIDLLTSVDFKANVAEDNTMFCVIGKHDTEYSEWYKISGLENPYFILRLVRSSNCTKCVRYESLKTALKNLLA